MNTILVRIDPLSLAKIMGVLYAALGLIMGAIFSMLALFGGLLGGPGGAGFPFGGAEALVFGVGAIVALPVMYGGLGFVGGLLVSVAESLGAVFLAPSMKELVSFSLLIVVLLFRPTGLFGRRLR